MAKEIARFQLVSGDNNLERWLIDDDANLIFDNTDPTKYVEISSRRYYSSAFFNFPSTIYGYLFAGGFLLSDKATKVYVERSTDGGSTWSEYRESNPMTTQYGPLYTMPSSSTGIGETYVINFNSGDGQCISSLAPLFDVAEEYNEYVANVYIPPTVYNWVSRKKIIGQNKKSYTLTEILNINDGNPVNNLTNKKNLDFSAKTKVNNLVNAVSPVIEDVKKAVVKYEVPYSVYEYCKIVYKEGDIPMSIEDGVAKDVDFDNEEVTISGLAEDTLYYFVVFTNKTQSEPYIFRTGKQGGIFKAIVGVSKGLIDSNIKDYVSYERVT